MTSSSPKKIDGEALGSSRLGCRDNIINFESIQKITVSGECPPPRPVSKPIEIQNNIKYNNIQIKDHSRTQKPMPIKPTSSSHRNLSINYNDLDELFTKLIKCSKEKSKKGVTELNPSIESPFRKVYTLLSLNNKNKNFVVNNNTSNIGTEQSLLFTENIHSNMVPFSVSMPKFKKAKAKKFLGEKTNRPNPPVTSNIKSQIIPKEITSTDSPKQIIKIPREEEEGGNTQNSSNNSVDCYNHKVHFYFKSV